MQHPAERSEKKRILSDLFSRPESLPVVLFILFFTILYGAGPELRSAKYVFEPPWLLFTLNTVFVTGLGLLVAWLCLRIFLRGGFLNILLLGCGMLAFGLSSFVAGWLIRPPRSLNDAVTIHNIGVLCTAALYFLSSLFTAFGFSMEIGTRRGMIAAAACSAVLLSSAALTSETVHQVLPPFFVIGEGPTVIRQVVLSVSVTLLITSALLLMTVYAERKTGFLLYSINALLLIGAGIVGVAIGAPGSPFNWLGRASQYLGNVYLVGAAMKALGEARSRGTTVEKALAAFFRTSETHFKALVELAADAIVSIDHKGKIILMNPAAEETFGYGRNEAAGQSLAELIVPEQSRELFHACLYGEPCRNIGMDLKRKDGTILPAELSFSPEMRSGAVATRTIIIRDVTERRRAEAALQESEERYRGLFESMSEGFALHELLYDESGEPCDYRFLDVNPAFERLTGLKRQDVVGKTVAEVLPGTEPYWVKRYGEVARTGTPAHFESHSSVLGRDYEVFAYRPASGQFAVIFMDITERIEVEQALRRSESRYRSYIEVTGQMGWTTNADGEVVEDVPALRQFTGQSVDEMRGWGWSKALHPDDLEITLAVWRKAVEEKQGYDTEYRLRRHDGVYRYFLARSVPVLQDDGSVREWVGTCIDITERRKQEEELRKLNRTLRALSRSNEALMRAEEESAFLEEVCRIVIQDCGYAMVWIGYASDDENKTVRPVAHAGFAEGYLETLNLTWADRERGRGPTGTAIRTGKPILCADMLTDPRFEPWRDEAIRRGYASSLALPLLDGGRAFGAVTIYSNQPDPFSAEEIELLSEMADDLTYGIESLRLRLQGRQTLQALQASEERFRQLADSMPQLVWTAEPDGRVDYFNSRLSLFTTCGPWRPAVNDEDRTRTVKAWKSAVRTGSPYEIEHRVQIAGGRFRWFLTRAVPVTDETGQVRKWYGTSTDVDDRRRAEEEREIARIEAITEKSRIEALMEALPVGVAMVDETGGNVRSNIMYEQIWGEPRPEARSVDDYDKYKAWWIDSGRQLEHDEWASARAVKKGETVTGQMLQIERFDGTTAFVMNSAVPIHDVDGKIAGGAVAILDITERIETERALQKVRDELEDKVRERTAELILLLEDLEKSRDDLRKLASELVMAEERERKKISVTLHDEVAQTLAAARMRIDLLRGRPGDDDSRRALDEAQQLLVQAIRETRSLMTDISNPVLYDMGLQVAVQSLTEEVKARNGISFSSSFTGSLKTLGQDMEVMIFQLVKELVQNIVKHSGAGTASIRIVEQKDIVRMVVTDDGQGFDVGNVGAVGLDGGFGLFSIRERVKSYGGKIKIESEPGKGSEVTVTLPKKAADITRSRNTRKGKERV